MEVLRLRKRKQNLCKDERGISLSFLEFDIDAASDLSKVGADGGPPRGNHHAQEQDGGKAKERPIVRLFSSRRANATVSQPIQGVVDERHQKRGRPAAPPVRQGVNDGFGLVPGLV